MSTHWDIFSRLCVYIFHICNCSSYQFLMFLLFFLYFIFSFHLTGVGTVNLQWLEHWWLVSTAVSTCSWVPWKKFHSCRFVIIKGDFRFYTENGILCVLVRIAPMRLLYQNVSITKVELQWLEHPWNHENMFETGVVRVVLRVSAKHWIFIYISIFRWLLHNAFLRFLSKDPCKCRHWPYYLWHIRIVN